MPAVFCHFLLRLVPRMAAYTRYRPAHTLTGRPESAFTEKAGFAQRFRQHDAYLIMLSPITFERTLVLHEAANIAPSSSNIIAAIISLHEEMLRFRDCLFD